MDCGRFLAASSCEIILPMRGNILIVVLILQITAIWNDYLIGVTFGGLDSQPMTVNLANIVTRRDRRAHLQHQHGGGAADRHSAARHLLRLGQALRPGHHRRGHQGMRVPCRPSPFEHMDKIYGPR